VQEAETIYRRVLDIDPEHADANHLLGVLLYQDGNHAQAVESISRAIARAPDRPIYHSNLGIALRELGRLEEAVASYRKALAIKPDYAEAHNNLGNALKRMGCLEEAVASYHETLAIKPDYAEAHYNLGFALRQLGRPEEAVACYHKALAIKPDYVAAHNNLGNALQTMGRLEEAVASYHEALAIKPDFADAHYNLVEVLDKTNRIEALREAVAVAKRICPGHPRLSLGEARLLKRDGDYVAARAALEAAGAGMADANFLNPRAYLLGEINDRLGDTEAAYDSFAEGNRRSRNTPAAKLLYGRGYLARIDALAERFTSDWVAGWRNLEGSDGPTGLVFMVGFPRSGTTLLDTILRSHAAITVVEEMPTVLLMREAVERLPGGYPDGLAELGPAQLEALRQVYFTELDKHLEPEGRPAVIIDKLPLNLAEAGLIHRIFPRARFVFVQRHPCDCVLSCFMQNFKINEAMVHFLDLEDAARLYDRVMTLWRKYLAVLPLQVHTVRYESLIEAFEETLIPVLDFLGVAWDDSIRNYAETASRRDRIMTPSYDQVTQPLYTRARGRWERYRKHLQPVLPTLLPWAKRFGYVE
jgi:tetratricopeptide (TPR) repeat protein